jgi:hypothetical protein
MRGDRRPALAVGVRSVLPYTLEFEFEILQVDRPNSARGELSGRGSWRFLRVGARHGVDVGVERRRSAG